MKNYYKNRFQFRQHIKNLIQTNSSTLLNDLYREIYIYFKQYSSKEHFYFIQDIIENECLPIQEIRNQNFLSISLNRNDVDYIIFLNSFQSLGENNSILFESFHRNRFDNLEELIKRQVDLNRLNIYHETILFNLVRSIQDPICYKLCNLFIIHHGSLTITNLNGETAIHVLCQQPHHKNILLLVSKLIQVNFNFDLQDHFGLTCLMLSILSNQSISVKQQLIMNTNVNIQNTSGQSFIHCCILMNINYRELKSLINDCIDRIELNLQDNNGNTALHLALQYLQTNNMRILMDHGADYYRIKNVNNQSVLEMATMLDNPQILSLFVKPF